MKITKLLMLSVAVIFLSCGDDDPMPTSSGMVGNWTVTAVDYRGTTTMSALGTNIKSDFTGTGKDMTVNTVFNENPNTVNSQGSYTIVLRTTTMGQTATEERTFDEVVTNGSWSLSGKKLTITDSHGPQEATILEQTSTALKIRVDVKESETNLGITVTTDLHVTYTFKK